MGGFRGKRRSSRELDRFISIGIGGASVEKNLWPEPHHIEIGGMDAGSITKDRLENLLVRLVRYQTIAPEEARSEIVNDWTVA